MQLTALLLFALAAPAALAAPKTETWKIGPETLRFVELKPGAMLVSEWCAKQACEAVEESRKGSTVGIPSSGGPNRGAVLCTQLNGTVVIGTDAKRNELSFCRFRDRSMIANSSLWAQALENDLQRP